MLFCRGVSAVSRARAKTTFARVLRIALVTGAAAVWMLGPTMAQVSLSVDPPRVEKLLRPQQSLNDSVAFTNHGKVPVIVSISVVDFDMTPEGQVIELPAGTSPNSIAAALRITPQRVRVEPDQRIFFRYSLSAPEGYTHRRGMIYFEADPVVEEESAFPRVVVATAMGIPFYIENPRAEAGRLQIEDLEWLRPDDQPGQLLLRVVLRNEGERKLRPKGYVAVESRSDNFAQVFDFNQGTDVILPGTSRLLERRFGPVPYGELEIRARISVTARKSQDFQHSM